MSIFFLNSTNRIYNDEELNTLSKILFSDGVFNTLQVTRALWETDGDFFIEPAGGNMNVTSKAGVASVSLDITVGSDTTTQQAIIKEDLQLSATVANNATLAIRNDAVVLRIDQSIIDDDELNVAGSNAVSLVVVSGNSATELTDTEITVALGSDKFIRLANIAVPLNATEITASMITDARSLTEMSRSLKMGSDSFRFFGISEDPSVLEEGDVWFNTTEGILKMYDGTNTIALQTPDFDWGYYPPDGVSQNNETIDPVSENDSSTGVVIKSAYALIEPGNPSNVGTRMQGEVFVMPNVSNPFIRVKLGNPAYQAGVIFKVYSVDGSNDPDTLIETPLSLSPANTPNNDYADVYLDGTLYSAGTTYILIAQVYQSGYVNADPADEVYAKIQTSTFDTDGYLVGYKEGTVTDLTSDPLDLTWGAHTTTRHFIMSISERDEYSIGETDATTNAHEVSQGFVSKALDIVGFSVVKGTNVGTPTGDVYASLYRADANFEPTGDELTTATIAEADWDSADVGDDMVFDIEYDQLVIGEKYVVVITTENHDDDNTYTIFFGSVTGGSAKLWNTNDGWSDLNGDFFYGVYVSAINKIVVTNSTGTIPEELIPKNISKRVTTITSSATPAYSTDTADAVVITALAENITSMTTSKLGTPSDFQELTFRITASGGVRTIAWGADFESAGVALDTSVADGKTLTTKFIYNAVSAKWGCVLSIETT